MFTSIRITYNKTYLQITTDLVTHGTANLERGRRDSLALDGRVRLEVLVDLLESFEGLWRVVQVADELAPRVLDAGAVVILAVLDTVEELHAHLQIVGCVVGQKQFRLALKTKQ